MSTTPHKHVHRINFENYCTIKKNKMSTPQIRKVKQSCEQDYSEVSA
jgi:hypothetical protein